MVAILSITIEIITSLLLKEQQEITSYPLFSPKSVPWIVQAGVRKQVPFVSFCHVNSTWAPVVVWTQAEVTHPSEDAAFSVLLGFPGTDCLCVCVQLHTISHSTEQAALAREGLAIENWSRDSERGDDNHGEK